MRANTIEFLKQHDDSHFPPEILALYDPISCLSDKEHVQTYLLREKTTGDHHVIKVYDKTVFEGYEGSILHGLHHPGIPRMVIMHETDTAQFVVRKYIQGQTIDEMRSTAGISAESAVSILRKLCDIASYLHGQPTPIIHRDIKPSNIIVDDSGNVSLIDFEIARQFDPTSESDTVMALTRAYAAPEQFGYAQTDQRSDIYGMGVVLLYMLTGNTNIQQVGKLVKDDALVKIIKRCTEFAPADRYQRVGHLQRDLVRVGKKIRQRLILSICAVVLTLFAMAGGYVIGYGHAASRPPDTGIFDPVAITFAVRQIENAVRLVLGKEDGSPIYQSDLDTIESLHIYGDRNAKSLFEFYQMGEHLEDYGINDGSIVSLEDLARLKNLKLLSVHNQYFTDVTPLANLTKLEHLSLMNSWALTDISPLSGLVNLKMLCTHTSPIEDLTPIAQLPIKELIVGGGSFTSIEPLRGNPYIEHLDIGYTRVEDLTVLLSMPSLTYVGANYYARDDFLALGDFSFEVKLTDNINSAEDF